jgi:hypothetical protein
VHYYKHALGVRADAQAMTDELPFRVVRSNSQDETLARCTNLPIAQAAYRAAARMYRRT